MTSAGRIVSLQLLWRASLCHYFQSVRRGLAWTISRFGLIRFNQFLDPPCVRLGMAVAPQWVGTPGRFNQDFRPDEASFDVHRRDLEDADADFIHIEPGTLAPDDGLVRDLDARREQEIPARPPACLEYFGGHVCVVLTHATP